MTTPDPTPDPNPCTTNPTPGGNHSWRWMPPGGALLCEHCRSVVDAVDGRVILPGGWLARDVTDTGGSDA